MFTLFSLGFPWFFHIFPTSPHPSASNVLDTVMELVVLLMLVTLLLRLVVLVKLLLVTESLGQLTPGGYGGWCPPMMFVG